MLLVLSHFSTPCYNFPLFVSVFILSNKKVRATGLDTLQPKLVQSVSECSIHPVSWSARNECFCIIILRTQDWFPAICKITPYRSIWKRHVVCNKAQYSNQRNLWCCGVRSVIRVASEPSIPCKPQRDGTAREVFRHAVKSSVVSVFSKAKS